MFLLKQSLFKNIPINMWLLKKEKWSFWIFKIKIVLKRDCRPSKRKQKLKRHGLNSIAVGLSKKLKNNPKVY